VEFHQFVGFAFADLGVGHDGGEFLVQQAVGSGEVDRLMNGREEEPEEIFPEVVDQLLPAPVHSGRLSNVRHGVRYSIASQPRGTLEVPGCVEVAKVDCLYEENRKRAAKAGKKTDGMTRISEILNVKSERPDKRRI